MSAALLDAVRKACLSALWSQGVKLAREGKVTFTGSIGGEATARVRAPGHAIAPTVTLFVTELEWSCDCGEDVDPCSHVAAAAIAFGAAPVEPAAESVADLRAMEGAGRPHRIRYLFTIKNAGLWLERALVAPDGTESLMTLSLTDRIARAVRVPALDPTHEDLGVDRALAGRPRGFVTPAVTTFVLRSLESAEVRFEGAPIRARGEPVLPRATLRSAKDGVELEVLPAPEVASIPAPLVALTTDGELRPLGATDLFGTRHESLPMRRSYGASQLAEVSSRVLPELERQLAVDVRTHRLPDLDRSLRPRLAVQVLEDRVHDLAVLPLLVYGDPPVARVDGATLVYLGPRGGKAPRRDEVREKELVSALRDELHLAPGRRLDLDGTDAAAFLARLRDFERRHGLGGHASFVEVPLGPRVRFGATSFELSFETEADPETGEIRTASPDAVMRSLRAHLAYVPLEDGGFARLPADWLEKHGSRLLDLLAARRGDGTIEPHALPDLRALARDLGADVPPPTEALGALLQGFAGQVPAAELPADLCADLRGYQREAVDWLTFLQRAGCGGVLADDMGLGKTLETLAALRGRTLVVCPRSVIWTWEGEARRFRPGLRTSVYHGPKRALEQGAHLVITTYAILRIDQDKLAAEAWDTIILDEAQNVKNPDSQAARAAFELRAPFRLALTGTPIENRLSELWSLFRFALPGLLGSLRDFRERYEEPIDRGDREALARLRARTRPFLLRRTKGEVAKDLPPRTESTELVELDEAERETYEAVLAATKKELLARVDEGASVLQVLEALLRLRQAACHSALVPGREAESSSKVERLVEMLSELASEGHRALVFSQWTSLLDRVEPHLLRAGLGFTRLDGSTQDRQGVVTGFQASNGPPVMLLSLKAGGAGLTLTAADHVFLLDPWWNPAAEDQAADRAHRIGQDKPVLIHRLVAKDTVEERVIKLGEKKRALALAALEGTGSAAAITRQDLLDLLS